MGKTLIGIIALVGLLAACYASLPWLVNALVAPRLIDMMDLEDLTLEVGYPDLSSLEIAHLHLTATRVRLDASNVRLSYNLQDLRSGRLENVVVEQLTVAILISETDSGLSPESESTASRPPSSQPLALESMLARVPADTISVENMDVGVPSIGFAGSGTLSLNEAGLEAQLRGVRPAIARNLNANVTISRTGSLGVSVEDPDSAAPSSVSLLAEPEDTRLAVQGTFSISGYGLELLEETIGIPAGTGNVSGDLATRLPWPLEDRPSWRTLRATAHLDVDWSLTDPAIELNDVSTLIELDSGSFTLTADGQMSFSAERLNVDGTLAGGTFTYRDGYLKSEDARLTITAETGDLEGQAILHTVRVSPERPLNLALTGAVELKSGDNQLRGNLNASLTEADNLEGTFDFNGHADAPGSMGSPGVRLQNQPIGLDGNYTLADNLLDVSAKLNTGPLLAVPFKVEHNLDTAHGALSFSHTQTIDEPLLHKLLPGWQEPYDLDGGELDLSGKLTWNEQMLGSIELRPMALTAHYDDYTAINAAGALKLALTDSNLTILPSTLSIEAIDIGIPVTNVNLSLAGSLDTLTVSDASAELLGGHASAGQFDYEIEPGNADITVTLSDIDLSEILALEGEDVSGTGRLSGTVPVLLRDNALSVEAGVMNASGPGTIMLSNALAAGITQPGLDIAFKALENFSYEALGINVNYDKVGNMQLGVRLEGHNPDLEDGRPVHFNLNVSENIPVLLQSLRLQDNFTKTLERRITR